MFIERGPSPEKIKAEAEEEQSPEALIEAGEKQKENILRQIRQEGEMVVFRLCQGIDKITGRKHHPELLRKVLLEFRKPITDIKTYRKMRDEALPTLGPAIEIAYGTLSLGARKTIQGMLNVTAKFGKGLEWLSEQTSKKFEDAKRLYGIEEKEKE